MRYGLLCVFLLLVALPVWAQDDDTGYQEALRLIDEARVSGTEKLYLGELGLTEIPPELWELAKLETLWLSDNPLTGLPEDIARLENLRTLYLYNTHLTTLPDSIGRLKNLTYLSLSYAPYFETLPDSIGDLSQLELLYLDHTALRELPLALGRLTKLTVLDVSKTLLQFPPVDVQARAYKSVELIAYLRDYQAMQARQIPAMAAGGIGLIAGFGLLWRWKTRRGTKKKKREI